MKRRSRNSGVSIIFALFMLVVVSVFALAAVSMIETSQRGAVYSISSNKSYFAAQSGIEWALQTASGFTTADKQKWLDMNGVDIEYAPAQKFRLNVFYDDPDNNPPTEDSVTITSQGFHNNVAGRKVMVTLNVPPPTLQGALFKDHFDQNNVGKFDSSYSFGLASTPHGAMTPYTTSLNSTGGDTQNIFTHSSEPSGTGSILQIGATSEARIFIHTGSCLKWNKTSDSGLCDYEECESRPGCEARSGIDAPKDADGYQNYFIKLRARLISGSGFGVYFRGSYPNENNPDTIDFSALASYVWQYDAGMGYLAPCDISTAIPGSDLAGMFFTRRVEQGSETCGTGCEVYTSASPFGDYPFFCPENFAGHPVYGGWGWANPNWTGFWRTIYIYVYRDSMKVYLGQEEVYGYGAESDPEAVGVVDLSQIAKPLVSGGIGIRTWGGSIAEVDYIEIYENDDNHTPLTFNGN